MRIHNAMTGLVLTAPLLACDPQPASPAVDPALGRECFESHRASLPPGTQYEGVDELSGEHLTIRIMNGMEVTTLRCSINPDGMLRGSENR